MTSYDSRISDWSSDVCASDLRGGIRRDDVMLEAREPACEPRHRRRDDEGGELVALDVVALEAGALLVLADCRQHVAEGRAQQQIGRACVGKECVSTCRSRWSP